MAQADTEGVAGGPKRYVWTTSDPASHSASIGLAQHVVITHWFYRVFNVA